MGQLTHFKCLIIVYHDGLIILPLSSMTIEYNWINRLGTLWSRELKWNKSHYREKKGFKVETFLFYDRALYLDIGSNRPPREPGFNQLPILSLSCKKNLLNQDFSFKGKVIQKDFSFFLN